MRGRAAWVPCVACALFASTATAQDAEEPLAPLETDETGAGFDDASFLEPPSLLPPRVLLHGFVSQGFILSTGNNYLARSRRGSAEFTEAAINATVATTDTLTVRMQLFSRDLGPIGDYTVKLDWFHLDWQWRDELGLRAGRVRLPFGLYNDTSDYDPGRVSVLLPQSLYPTTSREFLLALTGAEIYGTLDLRAAGYLNYRAYGGSIFLDDSEIDAPVEIDVPYTAGGRLMWETPVDGLQLGASVLATKLQGMLGEASYELPAVLGVASSQYQRGRLLLAAEYSRWWTDLESSDDAVLPSRKAVSERFYVLSTYELVPRLSAGAYYSGMFEDIETRGDLSTVQHDVAATLRYDINPYWLLKLEGHAMRGTGVVSQNLNSRAPEEWPVNWGVLLVKTTAYF